MAKIKFVSTRPKAGPYVVSIVTKVFPLLILAFLANTVAAQEQPELPDVKMDRRKIEEKVKNLENELKLQQKKYAASYAKLHELQKRLGLEFVTEETFSDALKLLQTQRIQLKIDLAGIEAKLAVVNGNEKEAPDQFSLDELKLLEERIQVMEKIFKTQQDRVSEGSDGEIELLSAQLQLLDAQQKLASFRKAIATESSSRTLNEAMLFRSFALDQAEKKARLETTETLLMRLMETQVDRRESDMLERILISSFERIEELQPKLKTLLLQLETRKKTP